MGNRIHRLPTTTPFTAQILEGYFRTIGGANLHRHIEGVLNHRNLASICRELDLHIGRTWAEDERFWMDVGRYMYGGKTRGFAGFAKRLSTRWMRLILIKGILEGKSSTVIIRTFADWVFKKAHREGIRYVDLLACPMALCGEHFLFPPKVQFLFPQEARILRMWAHAKTQRKTIPTTTEYFQAIKEAVVRSPDVYTWAGNDTNSNNSEHLVVGMRFCIRRDQKPEQVLGGAKVSKEGMSVVETIEKLYQKKNIVGVDIAGNEGFSEYSLVKFAGFFKALKHIGVPITVHAGELKPSFEDLAYENLEFAIEAGVARIGHAVRLFDDNPRMRDLLYRAIERGIFFEVNLTSNEWTGVAPDPKTHPVLVALRKEHSIAKEHPQLYEKLRSLVVFCDDDPVIFGSSPHPVVDEIAKACQYTNNLGYSQPREVIEALLANANRALLWKT